MNDESHHAAPEPHLPAAVFCDLDGTLVNTEQAWLETIDEMLASMGVVLTPDELLGFEGATNGQAANRILRMYCGGVLPAGYVSLEALGDDLERRTLVKQQHGVVWRPGAEAFLERVHRAGIPLVLVTSSTRAWCAVLARHIDLSVFAHIITADDVTATKPDPSPYLDAAAFVGADPTHCVVFEDSEVGLGAGLAAGCTTVLVREAEADWGRHAHRVIESLEGIEADWVRALSAGRLNSSLIHTP